MKLKRKIISLLLVVCLVVGLMPTVAFAANNGKAIQLGTSALSENVNTANTATVYFGKENHDYPGAWRVIGYDGSGAVSAQGDMTLLAIANFGLLGFRADESNNKYAESDLKAAIDALAEKLTTQENAAVNKRTLTSGSYDGTNTDCIAGAQVDNAVFWPLSTMEASTVDSELRIVDKQHMNWLESCWWLRSPGDEINDAAVVKGDGTVDDDGHIIVYKHGVRPAFHLNLNAVLFTSAAEGGKSVSGMDSGLTAVGDYDGDEWKLTLLDESRNFNVAETTAIGNPGDTITLHYTGATTGTNEYISVIIADNSGAQYYGRVAQPGTENGTVNVTIPTALADGAYTLYVFNEQYNGGTNDDTKLTDYASAFAEISLAVDTTAPTLTTGGATRTSETNATVTFTSDEAGTYYYEVVESGAGEPTIDTTGTGTPCDTTEQTIFLNSLTGAGAKELYIVAKDAAGNVSQPVKITIPEYVAPVYDISADPQRLDFGTVTEGYTEAPAVKTVTITNAGNQPVTLTQPTAVSYTIGALSKTTLAPADTATVTVRPNTGLTAGAYNETLTVYGQSDGYAVRADVELRFTVTQNGGGSGGSSSGGSSSGGGGGTPTYSATVTEVDHGTVTVSPKNAAKGSTVTVTVTPDAGYELVSLTVTDGKGNACKLTEEGGGQYTFVMPSGAVTVKAVFTKIEEEPEPLPFMDVAETAWYADAVRYVYEHGLMNGTDAQQFSPDSTTSRSMIATILWRMAGSPVVNYAMDFSDVAQGQWYSEAIRWAASEGIVGGYGNGAFGTNDPITREQFAVMLYRFAQKQGYNVSVGENTNILSYADAFDVSEYAIPAMQWACGAGIVNGSGANLTPQGDATRAQAAAMLMQFCEEYVTW